MGNLCGKQQDASEIDVLKACETKVMALAELGVQLTSVSALLMVAASTIKAENERPKGVPGSIRRIEVSVLLSKMLRDYGSDEMNAMFPNAKSLEPIVEIVFQLSGGFGRDTFDLKRAVDVSTEKSRRLTMPGEAEQGA